MSLTVFLDAGPLGILTNPKHPPETVAAIEWAVGLLGAGHRLVVPAIADYEIRRELERAGKRNGLAALDAFNTAYPDRYLPLSDTALRLGATLWARARNAGHVTADPKELDADVLIAAQAIDTGLPPSAFVIATVNLGHFTRLAPARLWRHIHP